MGRLRPAALALGVLCAFAAGALAQVPPPADVAPQTSETPGSGSSSPSVQSVQRDLAQTVDVAKDFTSAGSGAAGSGSAARPGPGRKVRSAGVLQVMSGVDRVLGEELDVLDRYIRGGGSGGGSGSLRGPAAAAAAANAWQGQQAPGSVAAGQQQALAQSQQPQQQTQQQQQPQQAPQAQ